jgi:hypothetical protein
MHGELTPRRLRIALRPRRSPGIHLSIEIGVSEFREHPDLTKELTG